MKMRFFLIALLTQSLFWLGCQNKADQSQKLVPVTRGEVKVTVQATGNVEPLNKVQILPPVAGRIDKILAFEGNKVQKGQILAWMSSSDRAALLDMARAKGPEEVKYWEDAYKATPIVAPTTGTIIARYIVEGQTVNNTTDLYDLSDQLVVRAQVDENDLAKVHLNQMAEVTVDAFPDRPFLTKVVIIEPASTLVNNVVSYFVQLQPLHLPGELKSGMTANVNFLVKEKKDILILPSYVAKGEENTSTMLMVKNDPKSKPSMKQVQLGDSDGSNVEVVSGLNEGDKIAVANLRLQDAASAGPFMGNRPSSNSNQQRKSGGGSR